MLFLYHWPQVAAQSCVAFPFCNGLYAPGDVKMATFSRIGFWDIARASGVSYLPDRTLVLSCHEPEYMNLVLKLLNNNEIQKTAPPLTPLQSILHLDHILKWMNVTSLRWGHISPKFHIYIWSMSGVFLQACSIWKKWKHLLSSSLLAKFISVWKMGCCFDNKTRRDSVLSRTSVFICILRVCKVIEPKHWEKMKRMTETYEETVKHASGLFLARKRITALKSL